MVAFEGFQDNPDVLFFPRVRMQGHVHGSFQVRKTSLSNSLGYQGLWRTLPGRQPKNTPSGC